MRISDWSSDVCSSDLAAITDVDAPQTRHRVEDALAVAVGDIGALGMGDDPAAAECLDFRPIGLRGQMMRDVEAAQFGDVVIAGHEFATELEGDRKSGGEGKRGAGRVDLGSRRIIKK